MNEQGLRPRNEGHLVLETRTPRNQCLSCAGVITREVLLMSSPGLSAWSP